MIGHNHRRAPVFASCVAICIAVMAVAACDRNRALPVRDSEGRTFLVKHDTAGPPTVRLANDPARSFALRFESRLVGVCAATESGAIETTADCRVLLCESEADCPRSAPSSPAACRKGMCVTESRPIDSSDAVMLCLWGSGAGHEAPAQVERFAMAQNCGRPCEVPTSCHQP